MMKRLLTFCVLTCGMLSAQQYPDTLYTPHLATVAYAKGTGPRVVFDAGHRNFGSERDGYAALKKLLRRDGYRVSTSTTNFAKKKNLAKTDVLVIINALHAKNDDGTFWTRPVYSAFTPKEIKVVADWVANGGNLLLVADHMPLAGAAKDLGATFGVEWLDGFAKIEPYFWPPSHFEGKEMVNPISPVISGLNRSETVGRVASFTGSAFKPPAEATIALAFKPEHKSMQPDSAWRFPEGTPEVSLDGYAQAATMPWGKGRVAFLGEAGMIAAQVFRGDWKAGFNSPYAPENARFALNLFHWLSGGGLSREVLYPAAILPPPTVDTSAVEREIYAANRAFENAWVEGDILTLMYLFDEEGVVVEGENVHADREAIDKYVMGWNKGPNDWEIMGETINASHDLATQTGIWRRSWRAEGTTKPKEVVERFTLVWRRNFAGNFKVVSCHLTPVEE